MCISSRRRKQRRAIIAMATGRKAVLSGEGVVELSIPWDRQGPFDSQWPRKHRRRFPGFDETIIALYAIRPCICHRPILLRPPGEPRSIH